MTTRQSQPITWPLLWLAVLLWPVDIATRRLLLPRPKVIEAWLKQVRVRQVRDSAADTFERQRARVRALQSATTKPKPEPQRRSRPVEPQGTTSRGEASSSVSPQPAAPQFDWRRTRRGMVERPGERRGSDD